MQRQRMKDLLLWARVVVRTWKIKFSGRRLLDTAKKLHQKACRTGSTIFFPRSTNQIIDLWRFRCCRHFLLPSVSQVFHPFTTESLILCSSFICTVSLGAYHSSELAGRARLPANAMDQCYRNGSCFWWNLSCSSRINNLVMRSSLSSTEQRSCIRQLADPAIRLKNGKQP